MKKKSDAKLSALRSAKVIKSFIEWARGSRERKTFNDNFASTVIYSNISEFVAYSLLAFNRYISKTNAPTKEKSNLEYLIKELEKYYFTFKEKIIPKLYKIKDQRNKLFHNLVLAQDKGLNVGGLMKNIQDDTEDLIGLWGDFLGSVFQKE